MFFCRYVSCPRWFDERQLTAEYGDSELVKSVSMAGGTGMCDIDRQEASTAQPQRQVPELQVPELPESLAETSVADYELPRPAFGC
jgi:hypothetical protein